MRFPMVASYVRVVVAVAAFGLRARGALAQTITEFLIPSGGYPQGIAAGPDGNIWFSFTESAVARIGRISVGGVIDEFQIPSRVSVVPEITAGPDGNLWFTEIIMDGWNVGHGRIGRITPAGVISEFPTPSLVSGPQGITAGPDGNLWYIDGANGSVGRITTAGIITEFPVLTPGSNGGIAAGPDGNLWLTESTLDRIGRFTLSGTVTEFDVPTFMGWPKSIIAGPDGNLWFTEFSGGKIGTITTEGVVTEVLSELDQPSDIAVGADNNLWFVEESGNQVWRLTTDGVATPYPLPTGSHPDSITAGPDGALWFTENGRNRIGRITTMPSPPATVGAIAPSSGPSTGGASIAIAGSGFQHGATVSIGAPASDVVVLSETGITATTPFRLPGTLTDLVVTNPDASTATLTRGWLSDFLDVDGADGFHDAVEKIFRRSITAGCGGGSYCRNSAVSRAQMAVFLLKAEHGAAYAPPDCMGAFPDVACPGTFANWIEQLASEGITGGCGGGDYCPDAAVTRQQMAVFLLKTEHGSSYAPPTCTGVFEDVACPGVFADWIEQLAAEQVTGGCSASPSLYCPENAVTRGQMAVFLTKTFGLQ